MDCRKIGEVRGRNKCEFSAEIYFRFNPSRFHSEDDEGRTYQPYKKNKNPHFLMRTLLMVGTRGFEPPRI